MPQKCSVIGCRGNYEAHKGKHADVNKVSARSASRSMCAGRSNGCVGFLRSCTQAKSRTTWSFVSGTSSHFVICDLTCYRPDGSSFTCARDVPVLAPDALLTLFPDTPSYLSTPLPPKMKAQSNRRAEVTARDDKKLQD